MFRRPHRENDGKVETPPVATKPSASRKGHRGVPVEVGPGRSAMRSILLAMMKSFSCNPLIFLVLRETVARPQPKLISG
jgi:hypothetical protein